MPATPRQLLDQSTRHAAHLERLKTQQVREVVDLLDEVETQLLGRLSRQNVTEWSRNRMTRQLSAYRLMMRESIDETVVPKINEGIRELAQYEAKFELGNIGNLGVKELRDSVDGVARSFAQFEAHLDSLSTEDFNLRYDFELPSGNQIMSAVRSNPLSVRGADKGKLLQSFVEDWTESQVTRTINTIRSGYAQGLTTPQIVRQIHDEAGPMARRGLEALTRTSLQHAAVQARQATWRSNSDIVRRVRIVATLDGRTTTQCRSLDGQLFPVDSGPRPPFHINCRTTTVAALDERFSFLDEDGTRRARDPETGKVEDAPAGETYYGWLKRQPASVQDSIIGPQRGKLLRDGGLTNQRFAELQLGRNFEPLTLSQMRELDPVAFKRAGLDD